jgi:meso-butanediol dehydrogenase/(S,S)-butanediol dehydrogenase/diacetyl reductase
MAHYGAYPAAKAGVAALMRNLALELAAWGITANAISPGPVATDRIPFVIRRMAELGGISEAEAERRDLEPIPLGRPGRPGEIAALVGFLAGPQGDWITGQEIFPNGGWVMP